MVFSLSGSPFQLSRLFEGMPAFWASSSIIPPRRYSSCTCRKKYGKTLRILFLSLGNPGRQLWRWSAALGFGLEQQSVNVEFQSGNPKP